MTSHLQRGEKKTKDAEAFKIGDLRFSLPTQKVFIVKEGKEHLVELTSIEFKMLLYLAKHEEHVLSRQKLIDLVWGDDLNITDRTIDTHISHIRKKISKSTVSIEAVYGVGYRFVAPHSRAA